MDKINLSKVFIKNEYIYVQLLQLLKKYQLLKSIITSFENSLLIKDITEKRNVWNIYLIDRFIKISYTINIKISIIIWNSNWNKVNKHLFSFHYTLTSSNSPTACARSDNISLSGCLCSESLLPTYCNGIIWLCALPPLGKNPSTDDAIAWALTRVMEFPPWRSEVDAPLELSSPKGPLETWLEDALFQLWVFPEVYSWPIDEDIKLVRPKRPDYQSRNRKKKNSNLLDDSSIHEFDQSKSHAVYVRLIDLAGKIFDNQVATCGYESLAFLLVWCQMHRYSMSVRHVVSRWLLWVDLKYFIFQMWGNIEL